MSLDPLAQIHLITIAAPSSHRARDAARCCAGSVFLPLLEVMARRAARIDAAQAAEGGSRGRCSRARERDREVALAAAKTEAALSAPPGPGRRPTAIRADRLAKASAEAEAMLGTGQGRGRRA